MSLVNLGYICSHLQNVTRVNRPFASIPMTKLHLQIALGLYKQGFLSSVQRGDLQGPDKTFVPNTCDNISSRRLWLGLKYHNFKPVLKRINLISKPSRRVNMNAKQIQLLTSGKPVGITKPLELGEVIFVKLADGSVVEIQEAAARKVGGQLLCRAI